MKALSLVDFSAISLCLVLNRKRFELNDKKKIPLQPMYPLKEKCSKLSFLSTSHIEKFVRQSYLDKIYFNMYFKVKILQLHGLKFMPFRP